jgi:hypothetical protein
MTGEGGEIFQWPSQGTGALIPKFVPEGTL